MSRRLAASIALPAVIAAVALIVVLAGTGDGQGRDRTIETRAQTSSTDAALVTSSSASERPDPTVPAAKPERFDGVRAAALLRWQVSFGQRPAGSEALRRLAPLLAQAPAAGRLVPVPGHPGLQNVVGSLPGSAPGDRRSARTTTRRRIRRASWEPTTARPGRRASSRSPARCASSSGPAGARELRFVLFDGEEEPPDTPDDQFYERGLRGSKAYAAANARGTRALILLDYVAGIGQRIPREGSSDEVLWSRLRSAAKRAGVLAVFPTGPARPCSTTTRRS